MTNGARRSGSGSIVLSASGAIIVGLIAGPIAQASDSAGIWISAEAVYRLVGIQRPEHGQALLRAAEFDPEGRRLLTVLSTVSQGSQTIETVLYDVQGEKTIAAFSGATAACFVTAGRSAVLCVPDARDLMVIEPETGRKLKTLHVPLFEAVNVERQPKILAGHPVEPIVAVGYETETLRLYDVNTGAKLAERRRPRLGDSETLNAPTFLAFSERGRVLWFITKGDQILSAVATEGAGAERKLVFTEIQLGPAPHNTPNMACGDLSRGYLLDAGPLFLRESRLRKTTPPVVDTYRYRLRLSLDDVRSPGFLGLTALACDLRRQLAVGLRTNQRRDDSTLLFWDMGKESLEEPALLVKTRSVGSWAMAMSSRAGLLAIPCAYSDGEKERLDICVYRYRRNGI